LRLNPSTIAALLQRAEEYKQCSGSCNFIWSSVKQKFRN